MFVAISLYSQKDSTMKTNNLRALTPEEEYVIKNKGTERPFTGEYNLLDKPGIYVCKQCGEIGRASCRERV